ncbi:protein YgfX [Cellvibrio sp. ARAG 10.3]|uniref:protein YgfX n=1 Tax=Cellvibrio sp. ARAG 10.3 TaxID=3451358 RepID=UPI003F4604DE
MLAVPLRPSRQLWYAQCLMHAALAISVTMAVMPLVFVQPSWGFLWLAGMAGLSISLRACYRHWRSLPCVLRITEQGWVLDHGDSQRAIILADDAVVLSWLIVLPCRDKNNQASLHIVILPDSTSPDMHRRLRVWLRTRR